MRIIQIVGRSNSGKTTFIKNLVPLLKKIGNVAVIKHLGDHEFKLEEGKDTTIFYEAGADIVVGIDSMKSVISLQSISLKRVLDLLVDQGMDFVVIEGFKQEPFPKIVIGSLVIDHCILINPALDDVIPALDKFSEYPHS